MEDEGRTWADDVREGQISVLRKGGQSILRTPKHIGDVVGLATLFGLAREIFTESELLRCNMIRYSGACRYNGYDLDVYELNLPRMEWDEPLCGPDRMDVMTFRVWEAYRAKNAPG